MKLGFIFDTCFKSHEGGYYSTNLSLKLWETRYLPYFDEVVVVGRYKSISENPDGKLIRSDSEKVKFKCMPETSRIKRIFSLKKENKFIEEAIKDCDAVICRSWWGVSACKKLNKKYMIEVVSCAWDGMWNHSIMGKLIAIPYFLKQKAAIRQTPYALYVTNEFLQRRYPTNGKNVGVSDVVLKAEPSTEVLSNRLNRQKNKNSKIILGTAAAVDVKYKGQAYVIKAIAYLKKFGYDNFEYQLAGNGDNKRLKRLADKYEVKDNIKFIGAIPHEKIFDWFDSLDVYVQPSLQEGLPRAVVEAMSRALPCVCMNTGGMPELIESKYICKKTGNIAKNFSKKILDIINCENMESSSKYNFSKSKEFEEEKLSIIRKNFMLGFVDNIRGSENQKNVL